jgi:hypothetical protein
LCETAKLVGVDPNAYLLRALYAAIAQPGTVIYPEDPRYAEQLPHLILGA